MLYTRKGDKGTTKLYNTPDGERLSKGGCNFAALGAVDELNAWLGLCRAKVKNRQIYDLLERVQQELFVVQAELAGADKKIEPGVVLDIEKDIANFEEGLPRIDSFYLPGQTEESAMFDVARTITRRAEREVVRGMELMEFEAGDAMLAYLNRLSSLMYVLVRTINVREGAEEIRPKYE